ncbi:hypothetical protein BB559_001336 [Furculomyces boomerangus]|uniref:Geranylgeranyl transferase type-2 subunit alpha n=2 Tax=Harpellales TaxID=61421 RepID=A0A2T9Z2G6_9FUNG|nr:hypothetical protein BB559_001336 [Furculomyces boomerangus]PVZ99039.1 hypothetical protein BB558_004954 [Smittium angustum]
MHGRTRKSKEELEDSEYLDNQKQEIARYRSKLDTVFQQRNEKRFTSDCLKSTSELLNLNPELNTVWNYRREILNETFKGLSKEEKQQKLNDELEYINVSIKKNIKSYWMWNHRQWILANMPSPNWNQEAKLVDLLFKLDATNFHGWDYRRYVMSKIQETEDKKVVINREFLYTKKKIDQNFANHSAWHYRSKLLPVILENEKESTLSKEVEMIIQAIYSDPDDQNAWLYFDWLIGFEVEKTTMYNLGIDIASELLELEPNSKYALLSLLKYNLALNENEPISPETKKNYLEYINRLRNIDSLRLGLYNDMEENVMNL